MVDIGIITSTRAEFGLLKPLLCKLREYENGDMRVSLVVTGTHLAEAYGRTIEEIEKAEIRIDEIIPIGTDSDSAIDIANNQADTIVKFTKLFLDRKYSAICILGDRYEMQMVAIAATNTGTPIFHLCGGDTTEGAVDESIRHSITKMSYLHFTTNEESRRRVIQLGEAPERVFNVGSTSIDNILKLELLNKEEALKSVDMLPCKYAIGTYHPVTLEEQDINRDLCEFLDAINEFPQIHFIITKANADKGGALVNSILDEKENEIKNMHVFSSLGVIRYLSLMKYAEFVIGNSSSGIIETPAFHVPTVNIGDRQKGRLQSLSTINCGTSKGDIVEAIKEAISDGFKENTTKVVSPYGNGNAAEEMADIILKAIKEPINLKKKFYNIDVQIS